MLPNHAAAAKKAFDAYKKASTELAATLKVAFPVGAEIEVRRPNVRIIGRVTGYSPSNPKEVWFVWESGGRARGRHDRFQFMHDDAKVTKYAL